MLVWLNGEFKAADEASISAASAGVLAGWGVFTTLGVWAGQPFAVERHLARLRRDAARVHASIAYDETCLEEALTSVIARNSLRDGMIRLTVTRRSDGRWSDCHGTDFCILAKPRRGAAQSHGTGLRLALSPYRIEAQSPLAGIKSTSYLASYLARQEAIGRGFDEVVLCNSQGAVCECAHANLFWARGGKLYTPSLETGCLPGIAREIILEWAQEESLDVSEGIFNPGDLASADEAFVTAATTGPRCVAAFYEKSGDSDSVGDNKVECRFLVPGPVTQQLQQRWKKATGEGHEYASGRSGTEVDG